jgi:N-acetyl-gamma-glutamyl-phosphate reductase, uncommon form
VDGEAGTTGLELRARLSGRADIELLTIDPALHRDITERKRLLNAADLVFLCLPDDATREAVSLVENSQTRVIDASCAFRTHPDWVYGWPEMGGGQREKIKTAKRVSVPGCHATGFNAAVYPLVRGGILPPDYPIAATSVSGYSGAGKQRIAEYEDTRRGDPELDSPRFYALTLHHKHLPEMVGVNGLAFEPVFTPMVGRFYRGMLVSLPLVRRLLSKDLDSQELHAYYREYYKDEPFIQVMPFGGEGSLDGGYFGAQGCNGTNRLELFVFGSERQSVVISRLDNLGKGASGAAVQCMNLMLGFDERTGLNE